ncbi:conserved hypothetical protein, membrane [Candidatus Magnetomorum sp. HK-1]|nr:conserved hypothetical protein, membrane [Candidatus Magnetomorum sp. HK-1]
MNSLKKTLQITAFMVTLIIGGQAIAKDINNIYIPEALKPWKQWVLHNKEELFCPFEYHNYQNRHCAWISRMNLDLNNKSGEFSMSGILFAEQWLILPGQNEYWPVSVFKQKIALAVIEKDKRPAVLLPAGKFHITGKFIFSSLPEAILIPKNLGLLDLKVNGKTISHPFFSKDHRLWLKKEGSEILSGNRMHLRVYRLIKDDIPMTMIHHIKLSVSGQSREESIKNVMPDTSIVMHIQSPLPIQIKKKKHLRIHVRPGEWNIQITTRFHNPIHKLTPDFLVGKSEIWSFKAQNQLRMVKLVGVHGVDPVISGVPKNWQHFPAYRVSSNQSIIFQEERRGDPEPLPDQLNLNRTLWLDFDGKGYTIKDSISGDINRNWRMNMAGPLELGRVSFSGKDQLITVDNHKSGVEIRTGRLNMTADARYTESIKKIPAIGWDHSMNRVQASLNLPPGWRLFSAQGVDNISGSWFERWQLLDFFLALLIVMAIYHLKNYKWAILALITMVLTFHEPTAPRLTWLHLVAVIALFSVVPEGRMRSLVKVWFVFAIVLFSIFVIPFMMNQIQTGFFPQLEQKKQAIEHYATLDSSSVRKSISMASKFMHNKRESMVTFSAPQEQRMLPQKARQHNISDVVVQTGPGLPEWRWKKVQLSWNGPVDKSQMIKLWLISPMLNWILSIMRVILVALLLFGITQNRYQLKLGRK